DEAIDLARKVKIELKDVEGLTVSVGIAPNKSIAKMASDMNKPDGLTVVRPDDVKAFLEPLPVNKISGVGKKTTEFLQEHGIERIGQLSQITAKKLKDWFGKGGVWLWGIANGIEETPVEERPLRKSISVEQTFEETFRTKASSRRPSSLSSWKYMSVSLGRDCSSGPWVSRSALRGFRLSLVKRLTRAILTTRMLFVIMSVLFFENSKRIGEEFGS